MNNLLFMLSHAPYRDAHILEQLDVALVGAVFDCQVSVLFRDDGIWALLKHQDGASRSQRTVSKVLEALDTYEINKVYVCAAGLKERGLTADDLAIAAVSLDHAAQGELIAAQDAVLGAQS